jgi:quercetin dioxygenase-like cupin family protein
MSIDILVTGNIAIREMTFGGKAGTVVPGHEHNFDHMSYVPRGAARFELLGADDEVLKSIVKRATDGFNFILIKAGLRHRITALTDDALVHCVYSHRTPQGDVVQEYDGWSRAYV